MPDDPFKILELEPRFDLSAAEIERAWLAKMALAHPDVVDKRGAEGGDLASRLNRAKGELEDAESRANLVLTHLGGPSAEDDTSLPDGFLMDIFGVREQMEQRLSEDGDSARRELREWASEQRATHIAKVSTLFTQAHAAGVRDEIRQELNVWRYTERMIEQLDPGYDPNVSDFR